VNNSTNPKQFIHNKYVHKTNYPIIFVLLYKYLSKEQLNYTLAITASYEPQTYVEASKDIKWPDAINKKIKALDTSADFAFYLALYASVGKEPKHIMAWWHFCNFKQLLCLG